MDARAADSTLTKSERNWFARERQSGRLYGWLTAALAVVLVAIIFASVVYFSRSGEPGTFVSPPLIALLLVSLLIPSIALMVLLSRRMAMKRAEERGLAGGRLHTRLVALFSVVAAVPTVLVAIFASLMFQSGLEFWFSDRARSMLESSVELGRTTLENEVNRVGLQTVAMNSDLSDALAQVPMNDKRFENYLAEQLVARELSEAVIFTLGPKGEIDSHALVNPYDRELKQVIRLDDVQRATADEVATVRSADRIGSIAVMNIGNGYYLYTAKVFDPEFQETVDRAQEVQRTYRELQDRSRMYQLRFNGVLLIGALIIVGLAIFFALKIADRVVRPVGELVAAAGQVEEGDFSVRVPVSEPHDEVAMLGNAFNRMTGRLQEQTGALVAANQQADTRRAFIEAVLSSVTAGVIALDHVGRILLVNRSAETLLEPEGEEIEGRTLGDVSTELAEFMAGDTRDASVTINSEEGQRTLAIKRARYADGAVLTFDDITDQLSDQRRAAWSDIARRIAHEIKNPLTPIQLAAERLQRRYGKEVQSDPETFDRLTGTIVRQVGDLRRMVDEFSNFARMPKPIFREENVHDIARAALFLHEVAHPGIAFAIDPGHATIPMVCDRRQLGQALTNVVKNAVEAIEARRNRGVTNLEGDKIDVRVRREDDQVIIDVCDTGIGLPEERERLTEPYMTTRVRGTGLGLAIVKKIVEEHLGEIAFLDRPGGGTHVRIAFDVVRLETMETAAADIEPRATTGEDGEYDEEERG